MAEFDLREAVHAVVNDTDLASPREIAAKVAENVPQRHLRAALADALVDYVRDELGRMRGRRGRAGRPGSYSPKRAAIADMWRHELRDRIHVGDAQWKLLGDCTYDDLAKAAAERREQARRNAARAAFYENLAELVREHGAATVAELPAEALDTAFGAAA